MTRPQKPIFGALISNVCFTIADFLIDQFKPRLFSIIRCRLRQGKEHAPNKQYALNNQSLNTSQKKYYCATLRRHTKPYPAKLFYPTGYKITILDIKVMPSAWKLQAKKCRRNWSRQKEYYTRNKHQRISFLIKKNKKQLHVQWNLQARSTEERQHVPIPKLALYMSQRKQHHMLILRHFIKKEIASL